MDSPIVKGHPPQLTHLALSYDQANSEQSALRLVYAIKPKWREESKQLEIIKFTDGITNTLLKIVNKIPGATQEEIDDDAVLMRAYGNNTEILIDRNREAKSHALLAERGLAPALLARFENGLLYKYIQGRVCTSQDLIQEPIWRAIAARLAEWHGKLPVESTTPVKLPVNGHNGINDVNGSKDDNGVNGIHGVDDYDSTEVSACEDPLSGITERSPVPNIWHVMQKWVLALPPGTEKERLRKAQLINELARSFHELDDATSIGKDGMIFGHCDLLSANVIILPKSKDHSTESSEEAVSFIDYEYATPCPAAFDIANHFAEWGGYDCDYNMLPTKSVRRKFLEEYLKAFETHSSQKFGPSTLEDLSRDIDRYRGMPGLYWGIWALIQAKISQIDFDYADYAEVRLGEYFAWREEIEGTRKRQGKKMPLREKRWAQEE